MVLLDQVTDVGSNRRAIKAHHEQLALHDPGSASATAAAERIKPRTIVLHGEQTLAPVFGYGVCASRRGGWEAAAMLTCRDPPTRGPFAKPGR